MNEVKELIKAIMAADQLPEIDSFDDGYGRTKVYGLTADGWTLRVWNASNNTRDVPFDAVSGKIVAALLEDETDGRCHCGFHLDEIMWEVIGD